jgi:hypothetical protein
MLPCCFLTSSNVFCKIKKLPDLIKQTAVMMGLSSKAASVALIGGDPSGDLTKPLATAELKQP